jgi:hypothetical protein
MYGSILIAVTFNPTVLSSRPVDEAGVGAIQQGVAGRCHAYQ